MPLDQTGFTKALRELFDSRLDPSDPVQLATAAQAFANLVAHFLEGMHDPALSNSIAIDTAKLGLMLRRFYRDAYGVAKFTSWLDSLSEEQVSTVTRDEIAQRLRGLGIRINTPQPRKTRVAAAFSLWMSTLRPIYLRETPELRRIRELGLAQRVWRLDATLNFLIATYYLKNFGEINIGKDADPVDRKIRLTRIWYDLTYRDLTLSSLELMYMSIFQPKQTVYTSASMH